MDDQELPPALSEAQTEIMNVVWEQGETTLANVCAAIKNRELARNTVQTQLTRLVEKGWLSYRAAGKTFFYRAEIPKDRVRTHLVQRLLGTLFQGSTEGLLISLLSTRTLSKDEAARIRALIEQAEVDE